MNNIVYLIYWGGNDDPYGRGYSVCSKEKTKQLLMEYVEDSELEFDLVDLILNSRIDDKVEVDCGELSWIMKVNHVK